MTSPESNNQEIVLADAEKQLESLLAQKSNLEMMRLSAESNASTGGYIDHTANMIAELESSILAKELEIAKLKGSSPESV